MRARSCSVTATSDVWLNPPPIPLTTKEIDAVYELPYARAPHPLYGDAKIPAWEMIRFSVDDSARLFWRLHVLFDHRTRRPHHSEPLGSFDPARNRNDPRHDAGFHGRHFRSWRADGEHVPACVQEPRNRIRVPPAVVRVSGHLPESEHRSRAADRSVSQGARACRASRRCSSRPACVTTSPFESPEYVKELAQHHTGGYLKIAPEAIGEGPLSKMMKPGVGTYYKFKELFDKYSKRGR